METDDLHSELSRLQMLVQEEEQKFHRYKVGSISALASYILDQEFLFLVITLVDAWACTYMVVISHSSSMLALCGVCSGEGGGIHPFMFSPGLELSASSSNFTPLTWYGIWHKCRKPLAGVNETEKKSKYCVWMK